MVKRSEDPSDVFASISTLSEASIHLSIISLSAEVHVFKTACDNTGGEFTVALGEI